MPDDPKVSDPAAEEQKGAESTDSQPSESDAEKGTDAGEDEVTRLRREILEAKIRAEERNRELKELRERANTPPQPTYVPPAGVDPRAQAMQNALTNLQIRANNGDEDALLQLGVLQRQQMQEKQVYDELVLSRVPEADREATRRFYQENRHRFGDPEVAHKVMLAERLSTKARDVEKEREDLAATEAQKRKGTVSVATRPVAAPEADKIRMRDFDEFERKHDELIRQGKKDEAWALSKRAATGELFRPS